jgi:hypothetical protein
VFCPNCGTKNDETATPCTKCGFKLSGASAPKFRGTMMLNTDQSVQELVDEHRRKPPEGNTGPEPAKEPSAPAPAGSQPPSVAKTGVQPPRAGLLKRRMGTMLGVAPQMGGVQPAPAAPTPLPAPPENSPPSAPDPLGGTIAFAALPPGGTQPLAASRTEAFAAAPPAEVAVPGDRPLAAGRTEAFDAPPPAAALPVNPLAAGRTEAFAAVADPAGPAASPRPLAGRTEAFEAPLHPQHTNSSPRPQRPPERPKSATAWRP